MSHLLVELREIEAHCHLLPLLNPARTSLSLVALRSCLVGAEGRGTGLAAAGLHSRSFTFHFPIKFPVKNWRTLFQAL